MRLRTFLCLFLTLPALSIGGCRTEPSPPDAPPPGATPLTERFDPVAQPYAFVLPNLKPVAGVGGVRAEDCGKCHKDLYREWQSSTHANALRDIQFQAEITKKDAPKWLCLNCHIPVQNQRSYIVTHLEDDDILRPVTRPNPMFDPRMQKEGVTCASCHVRRDEAGDSYIIGPFENRYAPHPVRTDPDFLRNICQRCHNPQGEGLTRNLVCWFETFRELETGRTDDGQTFILREYCAGRPLQAALPMAPDQVRDLAAQILEILGFVHLRGILHLDLKPALSIDQEEVEILIVPVSGQNTGIAPLCCRVNCHTGFKTARPHIHIAKRAPDHPVWPHLHTVNAFRRHDADGPLAGLFIPGQYGLIVVELIKQE